VKTQMPLHACVCVCLAGRTHYMRDVSSARRLDGEHPHLPHVVGAVAQAFEAQRQRVEVRVETVRARPRDEI